MGVSKLMDLLSDSREIIRNEVWLLRCLFCLNDYVQLLCRIPGFARVVSAIKKQHKYSEDHCFWECFRTNLGHHLRRRQQWWRCVTVAPTLREFKVNVFVGVLGIVVEDCLVLLYNLLKNNTSNQNFFKEGSFIQRLTPFFDLEPDQPQALEMGWSPQKLSNVNLMLQVRSFPPGTICSPKLMSIMLSLCMVFFR